MYVPFRNFFEKVDKILLKKIGNVMKDRVIWVQRYKHALSENTCFAPLEIILIKLFQYYLHVVTVN